MHACRIHVHDTHQSGRCLMDDDHIAVETVRLLAARLYAMQNPAGGS